MIYADAPRALGITPYKHAPLSVRLYSVRGKHARKHANPAAVYSYSYCGDLCIYPVP